MDEKMHTAAQGVCIALAGYYRKLVIRVSGHRSQYGSGLYSTGDCTRTVATVRYCTSTVNLL